MNDDLSDLKALMDQATPEPDKARRAANMALAQRNFANLHNAPASKPTGWRKWLGEWLGPIALPATAVVAIGVLVISPPPTPENTVLEPPVAAVGELIVESFTDSSAATSEVDDALSPMAEAGVAARSTLQAAPAPLALSDAVESELADTQAGSDVTALLLESGLFASADGTLPTTRAIAAPLPWDTTRHVVIVNLGGHGTVATVESLGGSEDASLTSLAGPTGMVVDETGFSPRTAILRDIAVEEVARFEFENSEADSAFAVAVYGFGILQQGTLTNAEWSYADAIALADANRGPDPTGARAAMVAQMRAAAP
ncbi:MAG: YfbK domain-containing protein [Pseudomonadota bacterium]